MNRRNFLFQTSFATLGAIAVSNIPMSSFAASLSMHNSSSNPKLYYPKIMEPYCPGLPISGTIGFMANDKNALQLALFYKRWYDKIICFSDGTIVSNVTQTALKKINVKLNTGKIVQLNETTFCLCIDTTTHSEKVDLLYLQYDQQKASTFIEV